MRRRAAVLVLLTIACVGATMPGVAHASWGSGGSGLAYAKGILMPDGEQPGVSVTGRNAVVTWPASYLNTTTQVNGYQLERYDPGLNPQGPGAGCSGTITVLTCTENAVPAGSWTYGVTPKQNQWLGAESPVSISVNVAPPSLSLTGITDLTSLPGSLSGTVDSFITGESVTFRLDDPVTGPLLTGSISPDPVPFSGTSSAAPITIPIGTSNGAHTVYAIGDQGDVAGAPFTVSLVDTAPPTISRSVIQKTTGGSGGSIRQNSSYWVYAQVVDAGTPPSGVATVRANVNNITTGQTNLTLTGGSWTVDGQTYNYRSTSTNANNPLTEGSKAYSITATDLLGNSGTTNFSVTVDNTRPNGSNVGTTNVGGGTAGRAETGDTITYTYNEPMDPNSFLAGWTGGSQTITARLLQQASGDRVEIWNAADTAELTFGLIRVGRTDYTTATVSFTNSTMVMSGNSITVTLGTPGGSVTTAAGTGNMTWTPDTAATDRAGNTAYGTLVNATGNPLMAF